ncbi:MAG: flagellar hook-associated protein FlgK [Alphaproteobacteria bacterium]|nr:flagellar hook-associated protein FlgK [Alphaproteobacteria bacterium]
MSLTISLQSALASLSVTQSQMQIVSSNVANASTEGYTKKTAAANNQILAGRGAGVRLAEIERIVDQNLLRQLRDQLARVGNLEVQNDYFGRMQDLFGTPGSNSDVSHIIGELGAALESLTSSPELAAGKFEVIANAQTLAERMATLTDEIQRMRRDADAEISNTITVINQRLTTINEFNDQIGDAMALGQSTADLEDARDLAIADLAELMDIQTYTRANGHIVVLTPAARPLVDNGAVMLTHDAVSTMAAGITYPTVIDAISYGPGGADITAEIQGGRLAGLIEMRDQQLTELQNEVDRLTEVLVSSVNGAHNAGTAFPSPTTLTGSLSFNGADAPAMSGTFRVTITDSGGAVVETQDIALGGLADINALVAAVNGMANATASLDANGKFVMSATGANRIAVNEMTSQVTAGNQTTGLAQFLGLNDLFTLNTNYVDYLAGLQTSATTALGLAGNLTFSHPGGPTVVAYGVGDDLTTIAANVTAALAAENITATVAQENGEFRLTLTDADGDNFFITDSGSLTSTLNIHSGLIGAAGRVALRSDILADPNMLSTGQLSNAATLNVGDFVLASGDSSGAAALAAALTDSQTFSAAGGLPAATTRLADYAASIVSLNSTQAASVEAQFEIQEGYKEAIIGRSAAVSDVNIDEEMSTLLVLQNAYQAAARVTQTVSQMMEVLVNIIN